ncbi:type IV secretory system conjugative DNA transfer family protein [Streptomyces antimicrobicus]|uniref:Type IV secretory system conjugative DNA transfer family protein n=1 Tax=Streptomyces antimicrobicus TaxID=2883108 RepID=A0ABS8BCT6_9ACTN|nr:type IV secretory system conjugative DNA transfer family protein [Streptomyces antimicrobicus]MCB5182425.1 type IV secretory system conjugative DNA transfer family protein [Streptomyces antimicrobicus]
MAEQRPAAAAPRGIPDGLLVGLLAFLLGLAVLVWTATGLAAWLARGAWPDTVTFARTPTAVRALIAQPHDVPAAWPDTDPAALSGWGLFWGLFVSQLLVLLVLTIFTMGVVTRTKARRTRARATATAGAAPTPDPALGGATGATGSGGATGLGGATGSGVGAAGLGKATGWGGPVASDGSANLSGSATSGGFAGPGGVPTVDGAPGATPAAPAHAPTQARDHRPRPDEAYRYGFGYAPTAAPPPRRPEPAGQRPSRPTAETARGRLVYAPQDDRLHAAALRIAEADGAALVVTSSPALWAQTKDARAKLGPVLLYDPTHRCDTPARMHWNPTEGCADRDTAAARALALLAPVRPQARIDAAVADTAETLLRSWLHAAALDDRPFKQLHRWAQGTSAQEPVRVLRTHPQAAAGTAGELESALTAHPERRDMALQLTARALSSLTSVHIRDACNPNRTDALTLASFVTEGGTLYVVGEPIEDPRTHPGAMPLLTALAASVVEHGRRMAARSSHGRLDPPLSLVLEDVAAVAPIPQLPELLTDETLPLLALCRSREQARSRWPEAADLPVG